MQYNCYFDESGGFDTKDGILCISGYLIAFEQAVAMDALWSGVLERYDVPYAHMVDCAHGAPPFKNMPSEARSSFVRELIDLVKAHTLTGFTFMARRGMFERQEIDPYSQLANLCLLSIRAFLESEGLEGDVAYFFEAGHKSQGSAYLHLADYISKEGGSLTFAEKGKVRLLQAADLLAWQSLKYVRDAQSGARPPRKDFLSLMQHRHSIFLTSMEGRDFVALVEEWPESRRNPNQPAAYHDKNGMVLLSPQTLEPIMPSFQLLPIWRVSLNQ